MSEQQCVSLATGLATLLETGEFSDLTIVCGEKRFAVHKNVICCQSKPLRAMCTNGMKESQESVIDLTVDTEARVSRLLDFLYRCDYGALEPDEEGSLDDGGADTEVALLGEDDTGYPPSRVPSSERHVPINPRQLSLHVDMYILADKYDIASLGALALRKFQTSIGQARREPERDALSQSKLAILGNIPHIYALTSEHNSGLRDLVVEYARLQRSRDSTPAFTAELRKLFETVPEFAIDVLLGWLDTPFLAHCRDFDCERILRKQELTCGSCCCDDHQHDYNRDDQTPDSAHWDGWNRAW